MYSTSRTHGSLQCIRWKKLRVITMPEHHKCDEQRCTNEITRAHRIKSRDYICLRIKLSWLNGLKCFIGPKLHLSISGHAKAYEPLVKLRRLCSGNIQGLILEDVLVNPAIANYHKLLNVLMQSELTRKPSPASEPVPETPTFSDRSTSGWLSRAPGGKMG